MSMIDTVHLPHDEPVSLTGANPSKEVADAAVRTGQPLSFYSARSDHIVYQEEEGRLRGRAIDFSYGPNELTLKLDRGIFVGSRPRLACYIIVTYNEEGVATMWRPL